LNQINLNSKNKHFQTESLQIEPDRTVESLGVYFNIGSNLTSTFFIGGAVLGDFVNVDLLRRDEFRQLILKTKPVQTVGYLLVDYI